MRVLVIGGSGRVAGLFLPPLRDRYDIRVLDPRPPGPGLEHVPGDATDPDDLARAVRGVDVVVHCAMGPDEDDPHGESFDVNVKSVHLALEAAHAAGVKHAVHVSSLSVYSGIWDGRAVDEDDTPDATDFYGLTKRLGEQVCHAAADRYGMSVNILRLAFPTPDAIWPGYLSHPGIVVDLRTTADEPIAALAAADLTRAVDAAVRHRDGVGVFTISGEPRWHSARAESVLGWTPRAAQTT